MRWEDKPYHVPSPDEEYRTITVFLWFPTYLKRIDGKFETRWLETAKIEQAWCHFYRDYTNSSWGKDSNE